MGIVLGELELVLGNNVGMLVEDNEADRTETTSDWYHALCVYGMY